MGVMKRKYLDTESFKDTNDPGEESLEIAREDSRWQRKKTIGDESNFNDDSPNP